MELLELESHIVQPWLMASHFEGKILPQRSADLKNNYIIRVGDRPIVKSIRKLFQLKKLDVPAEIDAILGEPYMITHAISVLAKDRPNLVARIGYEAKFEQKGSTVELFPNSRSKEFFAASLKFRAGIGLDGHAKLPEEVGQLLQQTVNLGVGGEVTLSQSAKVLGNLEFSVQTPVIQAIGHASSQVIWQFDRDQLDLVGDQLLVQTVVVPRDVSEITYKLRGYAVLSKSWFDLHWGTDVRIETEEHSVTVDLKGE